MIELRHLKLVAAFSKTGSLKKAAETLYLTQSALSHQLKELESHLGIPVFHRVNNQLHFTAAGKEFLESATIILENLKTVEERMQQIRQDQLKKYIHGYSAEETRRLQDQARTIAELLHHDSRWEDGALVLEAGCGVGAQTRIISVANPSVRFVSVDISEKSLTFAADTINNLNVTNVEFRRADVSELPFEDESFDHVFVCFLLEHLGNPEAVLKELKRVLRPQGTITVIEGDHGSAFFYPESPVARKLIQAQVSLQQRGGGNANIGRELYPLLMRVDFADVTVVPRQVYVDDEKQEMLQAFVRDTFTAMIKGIGDEAISQELVTKDELEAGLRDLYKTAEGNGTFSYTFFKAKASKG
jgi:ubiquinone/menaquinone biosynthesis C-methylase UbiE